MPESVYLTILEELGKSIELLKYELKLAQKENDDLRQQMNDLCISIHIGKEVKE